MGNVTGPEHKTALLVFRECALQMIDAALEHTTLDGGHVSVKRMRLLREQINGLSLPMLVYFSKKWLEACVNVVREQIPPEEHLDSYIGDLKKMTLSLPNNGNGMDVHNVIIALPMSRKHEIVQLVHTTHEHANRVNTIAEQHKKAAKPPKAPKVKKTPLAPPPKPPTTTTQYIDV